MLRGFLGLGVFVLVGFLLSENKKAVRWKLIGGGVILQFLTAMALLKLPYIKEFFFLLNKLVLMIEKATLDGSAFMFGYLGGGKLPYTEIQNGNSFIMAFRVLPIVLVMSALAAVLFHWSILQRIVKILSKVLQKTLGISGVQGLGVGANVFLGIVEAPLFIRPYLASMTHCSLFTVMTAGMATVAGTVMVLYASILRNVLPDAIGHILIASLISAPAAVLIAHLMVPETEDPEKDSHLATEIETESAMDALIKGAMDGIQLILSIVAMIIVLFSVVSLLNQFLFFLPEINGKVITLEYLVSFIFYPVVWLMGIPLEECAVASNLMATKTVLNEFVSYQKMGQLVNNELSMNSRIIMTYAMCGFANLASLGLIVGSFGTIIPERRSEVVSLGFRSVIAGTLATCMTGAIVSILIKI